MSLLRRALVEVTAGAWFVLVGTAVGVTGCGGDATDTSRACTRMGCGSHLEITVADDGGTPGSRDDEYVVTVTSDGLVGTCRLVIVEGPGTSEHSSECTGDVPLQLSSTDDFTGFTVAKDNPGVVQVTVTLDGAVVYDETLSPEYVVTEPNGPGCGTCSAATVPIELAFEPDGP